MASEYHKIFSYIDSLIGLSEVEIFPREDDTRYRRKLQEVKIELRSLDAGQIIECDEVLSNRLLLQLRSLHEDVIPGLTIRRFESFISSELERLKGDFITLCDEISGLAYRIKEYYHKNFSRDAEEKYAQKIREIEDEYKHKIEDLEKKFESQSRDFANQLLENQEAKPIVKNHVTYLRENLSVKYEALSKSNFLYLCGSIACLFVFFFGGYELLSYFIKWTVKYSSSLLGLYEYNDLYKRNTWYDNFLISSVVVSKVGIAALLTYSMYFFGKNYYVFKHNSFVAEHRAMSLEVYEAFISKEFIKQTTKDQLTAYASEAIFSHQDTGFLKNSSMSLNVPNVVNMGSGNESKS